MLARPYTEERAFVYIGRFSGYAAKGMRIDENDGDGSGALAHTGKGAGAYMNVKISLKLSRTSSAPWEVPVE